MKPLRLLLFTSLLLPQFIVGQTNSVLSEGKWLKMKFTESGVYKITWSKLREMGFEPSEIDPRNIAIFGNPGGMLPQALSEERPQNILENPILVKGQSDGVFGQDDYILFYVDAVNETVYNPQTDDFRVIKNLYSDQTYYFLTVKAEPGLRIESRANLGDSNPEVTVSRHLISHELDEINLLSSGREWFGEQLNAINTVSFSHNVPNIASGQVIKVYSEFVAQAFVNTSLQVALNSNTLGSISFESIPNSQYAIKGNIQSATFQITSNQLSGSSLNLGYSYNQNGANSSVAYLNKYLIDVPANAALIGNQTKLRFAPNNNGISTYKISGAINDLLIWDLTQPSHIVQQEYNISNGSALFGAFSSSISEYQAFIPNNLPEPIEFVEISNQNLRGSEPVDFLIITNNEFKSEAQRLADFRTMEDQLSSAVITVDQIYNEFSSGRQDITAIRDFIKHKYDQGQVLKYVLLFGKGSYDYKNRIDNNSNIVPTYESRNSIHPLLTYSSDDFFGFLDENEGRWEENTSGDHILNIGLGRIPAKNLLQAKKAIDKIILYQTHPSTLGEWKSKLLFVADDGDRNIHQRDADQLSTLVDTSYQQFQVKKLFLDSFEQERTPNGEFSREAEEALIDAVNEGRLIINFTGHGAEFGWMHERILTFDLMEEWQNPYKLPFLITATCEFGRNDDPNTESGAERLMFKNAGGAIGMLTTARPVFSSTNYRLNQALYGTIFKKNEGQYQRLGDIIKNTKNNSLEGSLNRNFILLGDPSMRLAYPEKDIEITEINGKTPSISDTLRALQPVLIKGVIKNGMQIDSQFNGEVVLSFFDKSQSKTTRGSENAPFQFKERDRLLFKGMATVQNGEFQFELIIPKNIDYAFGNGKIQIYAVSNSLQSEAIGSTLEFVLGGTYQNPNIDVTPPQIKIFLNDTISPISGIYTQDVRAIVKFFDESGINISEAVLGQSPILHLNDSLTFDLNSTYSAELNSFKRGYATLELASLSPGQNQISVTARDIYGNSSTATIDFMVQAKSSFITEIKSYPNPFIDETFFNVRHELEGENLKISVEILNSKGQPVQNLFGEVLSAEETLVVNWDGKDSNGLKLQAGIYFYTFRILSNTSGKSDFVRRKLIISN